MATLPPPVQEFGNFIDLRGKLKDAIAELKKQREAAEAELTQSLARGSAAAPLSVDAAIAIYKDWKFRHAALEAKNTDATELEKLIDAVIRKKEKEHRAAEDKK
jgi:hypothetical protein